MVCLAWINKKLHHGGSDIYSGNNNERAREREMRDRERKKENKRKIDRKK